MPLPRHLRGASVGLAAALTAVGVVTATAGSAATPLVTTVLSRAVVPGLSTVTDLGATPAATTVQVGVSMLGLTKAARDAAYVGMTTKGSPYYGQTWTPAQFDAAFAVPAARAALVRSWATGQGLTVGYANVDGSYLILNGTAAQVDRTFAVTLEQFSDARGQTFFATTTGPTVPVGVDAVLGLTDLTKMHLSAHPAQDTCVGGTCTGVLTPQDLWKIYDQPDSDKGAGEQVAIFGEGQLDEVVADVQQFQIDHDLTRPDGSTVPIRRVYVNDDMTSTDGTGEWDLDSAAITGMAPQLDRLSYYFGTDLSDTSIAGTYSAWADDPDGPVAGNSSFGGCEILNILLGGAAVDDALMQKAAMEGRTMFVSTGDVGGGCGVGPVGVNGVSNGGVPQVEYPSSSPFAVAVGGSVLYTTGESEAGANDQERVLEYAWTYTGGGNSQGEKSPADQANIPVITLPCTYTNSGGVDTSGATCRGIPDVAAVSGDVLTNGYTIYSGGKETESGGTSLSSPLWAGMWARVMAAHPKACSTDYAATLGFAQPALYAIGDDETADAADFFDIGNPDGTSQPTGNGQYPALPRTPVADPQGWDFVSGLGTPDVQGLMTDLNCGSLTPVSSAQSFPADVVVPPPTAGCVNGVGTDVAGDETNGTGLGPDATGDTATDLVGSTITATTTDLTWVVRATDLNGSATGMETVQDIFTYGGTTYALVATFSDPTADDAFSLNTYDAGTTTTIPGTITGAADLDASTVTMTMPFDVFNTGAKPMANLQPGSVLSGVEVEAYDGPGGATSLDTLAYGSCPFIVQGVPQQPCRPRSRRPRPRPRPPRRRRPTPRRPRSPRCSPRCRCRCL